ncbi:MAG: hypothetical protein OXQ86_01400 [Gammaproteobacteria bacterium]|nr:hypothetical protein [Gammaproteobacteria bacterium]MDE0414734.1 hypothetical protein [Gammaproteobacteria bacterium]
MRIKSEKRLFDGGLLTEFSGFTYLTLRSNAIVLLITLLLIPVLFAFSAFAESLGYVRTDIFVADILVDQQLRRVIADPWIPIMTASVFWCCIEAPRHLPSLREWRTLPLSTNRLCTRFIVHVSGMLAILVLLPVFAVLVTSGIDPAAKLFFACLGAAGLGLAAVPLILRFGVRAHYVLWVIPGIFIADLWVSHGVPTEILQKAGAEIGAGGLFFAWILIRSLVTHSFRAYRYAEPLAE